MTAIVARSLTRRFGDTLAVDDLSFSVAPGEIVGLLGANGAGKTTTMRMTLGLLTPSGGEVEIAGRPARLADRRIMGYVPQGLGLYRDLTVWENLRFTSAAFGVAPPSLEAEGLAEVAHRRVGDLSLGLRRRVAFAAARCHSPTILILDEPTSGVGPLGRSRLWETIHETAERGAAILVSTHHMEEAEECDGVVLMAGGRQVASGTVTEVVGGLRSVAITGRVEAGSLETMGRLGGTVLLDGSGWRVVGLDPELVRGLVGGRAEVDDVPATFEEAFVALSR